MLTNIHHSSSEQTGISYTALWFSGVKKAAPQPLWILWGIFETHSEYYKMLGNPEAATLTNSWTNSTAGQSIYLLQPLDTGKQDTRRDLSWQVLRNYENDFYSFFRAVQPEKCEAPEAAKCNSTAYLPRPTCVLQFPCSLHTLISALLQTILQAPHLNSAWLHSCVTDSLQP